MSCGVCYDRGMGGDKTEVVKRRRNKAQQAGQCRAWSTADVTELSGWNGIGR